MSCFKPEVFQNKDRKKNASIVNSTMTARIMLNAI